MPDEKQDKKSKAPSPISDDELARARALVARADAELAAAGMAPDSKGRLPQVLRSHYDVRRGQQVLRIPAGSVVTDTELTEAEFDLALELGIIGEATLSDILADKQRKVQAEADEKAKVARRDAAGVTPKSASKEAPAGSTLVVDLDVERANTERTTAAREIALQGTPARGPDLPAAIPSSAPPALTTTE